jgi:hypothetical protein
MTAIAGNLNRLFRVLAILAAILAVVARRASAGRMCALLGFVCHVCLHSPK